MASPVVRRWLLRVSVVVAVLLLGGGVYAAWRVYERRRTRVLVFSGGVVEHLTFNDRDDVMTVIEEGRVHFVDPERSDPLGDGAGSVTSSSENREFLGYGAGIAGGWATSDDGERMAYGFCSGASGFRTSKAERVEVWSVRYAQRLASYAVSSLSGIAFSPDGKQLIEGKDDGAIEYRDLSTGAITKRVAVARSSRIERISRGCLLLNSYWYGKRVWELRSLAGDPLLTSSGSVNWVEAQHDFSGRRPLVVQVEEAGVVVRSVPSGHVFSTIKIVRNDCLAVALSDEGEFVAISFRPGTRRECVELFSVETGAKLGHWDLASGCAFALAFMHQRNVLAIGTESGKVELHPFFP